MQADWKACLARYSLSLSNYLSGRFLRPLVRPKSPDIHEEREQEELQKFLADLPPSVTLTTTF